MKQKKLAIIISIVFIILGFILNSLLIQASSIYKKEKESLAETMSYKNRFLDKNEWEKIKGGNDLDYKNSQLSVTLAFGTSKNLQTVFEEQEAKILDANKNVFSKFYWVLALIFIYLLIMSGLYFSLKPPFLVLITIISVSIVCLHAGLFTPMLEIGAIEKDLNLGEIPIQRTVMSIDIDVTVQKKFEGDMYFYYKSKSIAELIRLLFTQGNLLVGFSILIFSVIFPLLKTCLMVFFVFKPEIVEKKWFSSFVLNLSKWSMADVFVVAIFLGFLAFSNLQTGIGMYSSVSIGLYFFFSYCILSIISSMMAKMPTEELITTN